MDGSMIRHAVLAASALAGACAVAACGGASAAAHPPSTASPAAAAQSTAAARSTPKASPAPATRSTATPAPTPLPRPRVSITRVRTADGTRVTIATFLGPVRYVLHNGSADPGPAASGRVRAGPAVTGAERSQLLAAFNGGFKLSAGAGGYMQEGHVISPLRPGFASLVIDRSGRARIGVWGSRLPAPGEAVYSVRQDLRPLVLNGRPAGASADWTLWGATLGGGAYVARSAIGQDAAGHLMYAASLSAVPADLAAALARHARGSRWNSTSTRNGSSRTPRTNPAAHSPPRYLASTVHPASISPDGPGISSPSWLGPPVLRAPSRRLPASGRNNARRSGSIPEMRRSGPVPGAGPARGRAGMRPGLARRQAWRLVHPFRVSAARTHRPPGPDGGRTPQTMPASAATGWKHTSASPASRSACCQNCGVAGCSGPTRRP